MAYTSSSHAVRGGHTKLHCLGLAFYVMLSNRCLAVSETVHVSSSARTARHDKDAAAAEKDAPHTYRIVRRVTPTPDSVLLEDSDVEEVVVDDDNAEAYYTAPADHRISHSGAPVRIVHRSHHTGQPRIKAGEMLQPEEPDSSPTSGTPSDDRVQFTMSVNREDLPQLLEGVAQGIETAGGSGETLSKDSRAPFFPGAFETTTTDEPPADPTKSQKAAGTTPKPDKSQELPAPSPMPKPDTSDDSMKGLPLFIVTLLICCGCCSSAGLAFWWFCMGGRNRGGIQEPLSPASGDGDTAARSNYRDKRKKPTVGMDPKPGDSGDTGGAAAADDPRQTVDSF